MLQEPPFGLCARGAMEKKRVFKSKKNAEPLRNRGHWFDDAAMDAGIKNVRCHDLR